MATVNPTWTPGNLIRHFRKRIREHPDCLRDLLASPPAPTDPVNQTQYELIAQDAIANSWGEFDAEWRSSPEDDYSPAAYYVDDRLVVSITDPFRREYITCYHKHALNPPSHRQESEPGGKGESQAEIPGLAEGRHGARQVPQSEVVLTWPTSTDRC